VAAVRAQADGRLCRCFVRHNVVIVLLHCHEKRRAESSEEPAQHSVNPVIDKQRYLFNKAKYLKAE
jgi:hypothetical protein